GGRSGDVLDSAVSCSDRPAVVLLRCRFAPDERPRLVRLAALGRGSAVPSTSSNIVRALRLAGAQPAVDDETGAHHEARLVGSEVESGTGDVLGLAELARQLA